MSEPNLKLYTPKITDPNPEPNLANYGPSKFTGNVLSSETTLTRDRSIDLDQTHLDENTIWGTSLNEGRAAAQTTGDKWASGIYKGVTTFATATGETAGVVAGGIAALGMTALGNPWDSDTVFKNPIISYFADLNDRIAELNPNYYSEAEQNASVLSNMGTANFWSDKVMNGIGFMASAMLTAGGAAKIGAKLGLKAIGSSTKIAGMSVSEGVNTLQAGIIGRMGESGIEANETYENTLHTLEAARKAGTNNYTDEEIEEMAKDARAATFGFNMMLAVPDAYQFGKVFKTLKGQKVGRSIFGKSRVGHAAEQFIIESQEENYQLAVSNTAMKMANRLADPTTEQGAGEYLGNIVGGMVDNFRTKEGQESMVLGGLLGGGMGLAFNSNDRTQKTINNIPEEILYRNNEILGALNVNEDAEALKLSAVEKNDMVTAALIEDAQITNMVYSAIVNNKTDDMEAQIDMLSKITPEEFLTAYEIEVTEEEIKQQHQVLKQKLQQGKDRYQSYPQTMKKAVKGNLFFMETAMDAIRDQMIPALLLKGLVDQKIQNDKDAGIETDLDALMTIGPGDSVIPSALTKDVETLQENLKVLNDEVTLLKAKGPKGAAARKEVVAKEEKSVPEKKEVKEKKEETGPIGKIKNKQGIEINFTKQTENDDGSQTYTVRDDEGIEHTVNSKDGWNLSGVAQETSELKTRGNQVERDQTYTKAELPKSSKGDYTTGQPLLNDIIENDPNWREKIKIRVVTGKNLNKSNVYQNEDLNRNTQLIPGTSINFNITVETKDGRELIVGHIQDPLKFTDLEGNPIILSEISDEEFYENFTFTKYEDGNKVQVEDAQKLENLRREQRQAIDFFKAVEAWFEGKPDSTEIPSEFLELHLASKGFAYAGNGQWQSPSEHQYLLDENGDYTIIDKVDGYNSITNEGNHADSLSKTEATTLFDTRYLILADHPTLGKIWVKAAPQTMSADTRKEITAKIKAARLKPTKKQIDELNELLYIAYQGDWNFKFDKANKKEGGGLRIDAFKTGTKEKHRIILSSPVTNLGQLVNIIKKGTGGKIVLVDSAFKNSIPLGKITTSQANKMFTVGAEPKIVDGVSINFGFNTDSIELKSKTKPRVEKKTTPTPTTASVPVMTTKQMKQELADLGYTKEQRGRLTPTQARQIIHRQETAPKPKTGPKVTLTKKQKINKEIEDSDAPTSDDDTVFKKSDRKASKVLNFSAAKSYLADKLPPTISVEEMEQIMDNIEERQYTWGQFSDNTIYLSEFAEEGTQYHEAFHAVFRTLLTDAERKRLYKISTSKLGRAKPIVHEEDMSNTFTKWKNDRSIKMSGLLRAFFNRIMAWGKWITGNETELEQLFRRIDSGAFQNKVQDFSKIDTFAPAYKLLKGHKKHFKMTVSKSMEIINTATGFAYNNIKGFTGANLAAAIEKAVLSHMDTQAELLNSDSAHNQDVIDGDPKMEDKLNALEGIYLNDTNRALVVAEAQKLLSMYEVTSQEASIEELEDNEEPERSWDLHQGEVGGFKNINKEIKQFIALAQFEVYDAELKRTITRSIDFQNVYSALQRRLAGKKQGDMLEHLQDFAETDEQINAIWNKFLDETGYNPETESKEDIGLFIRFLNTFKLESIDYVQGLKITEDNKVKLQNLSANRNSAEEIHFENWKRQGSNLNVFKNRQSRISVSIDLNKSSNAFELDNPTQDEVRAEVPKIIEAFKAIGVDLATGYVRRSLEEFYGFKTESEDRILVKEDITILANDVLGKGQNPYSETLDTETGELIDDTGAIGRLKSIASGDINYRSDIFETNFQDAEGKTRWSFVQPSYILEKIRGLKSLTPEKLEELRNDPYFKYNTLIQSGDIQTVLNNLATAFTGDFRDTTSKKEGVTFKSTNPKDLLLSWYSLYNNGETKNKSSFYTPMIYEAKSTSISIQLPDKGDWVTRKTLDLENLETYFRGILPKATVQHFIDTVFTQEHQRLNGQTGIEYVVHKDEKGKIVNPWVSLPFFNGVKTESGKLITEYSLEEIENNKDKVKTLIANTIKDGLAKDMARHAEELQSYGIISNEANELGIAQEELGAHIANYFLNDFNNSIGISQLLVGDLAQFKSPADHVKRMGGIIAYGTSFGPGTYNVVYKEEDKEHMPGYKDRVDKDDAQVYTTVQRRMDQLDAHGAISKKQRPVWEKIRDGKKVTPEEYKLVDGISMKTVHFDGKSYHKMSEAYISREWASNNVGTEEEPIWEAKPERVKDHNMLEFMLANEVDSIVTMSASKMRNASNKKDGPSVTALPDSHFTEGVQEFDKTQIGVLNNSDIRLQVENRSGKRQIVSGTQMAQLIDLGLDGKEELQEEYYKLLAKNRAEDFAFALGAVNSPLDVEKIAKKLIESVESTGGDAQMMEFLSTFPTNLGTKKFKYNINLPHVVEKLESMFLAHLSKGTLQQKVPGYKLTLRAASGVQILDKKSGKPRDLKMHKLSKDGKTIELAEVMMTRGALADLIGFDKAYLPIEDINKELLKMVGTRIPTQAHHSMIPFEIVEFLPEDYKDTVIAPAEITVLSGADYDIDSLFVYRKDFFKDIDGEVIIYGEGKTLHEKYSEYVNYHSKINKTIKKALATAKIEFSNLEAQEIQELVFEEHGLISSLKEFKKSPDVGTNGARNNRLVEIYLEVLTDPTIEDMFEPATLDLLDSTSTTYFKGIQNKTTTTSLHYSVAGKFEAHKSVSTGKKNIGPIASANSVSAFFTKSKIVREEPLIFLGRQYSDYSVMEEDDIIVYRETPESPWIVEMDGRDNLSKVNSLSTLVSGMTDDAKFGYAAMLNLEKYNLGTFANMISLGMGFNRTMLFASQPVLVELSKEIATSGLSQRDTIAEFQAKLESKIKEDDVSPELTEQALVDNLQKEEENRNAMFDAKILDQFITLESAARPFQAVGSILGLNKGEVGNSVVELRELQGKIEGVINPQVPQFKNLTQALFANSNTSVNMGLLTGISHTMGEWFISGSSAYSEIVKKLMPTILTGKPEDAKTVDRAIKSYLTAKGLQQLMQKRDPNSTLADFNGLLDPSISTDKIEQTLAKQIQELSTQEDKAARDAFNENEFIKVLRLNFKLIEGKFENKSNKGGLDLVDSSMRIKRSPLTVDRIMNGFLELSLENKALANNFLRYAMVKDNLQFTNTSFLKFLDASLFKPISTGLDNIIEEDGVDYSEEFMKVFGGFTSTRPIIKVSSKERMSVVKTNGLTLLLKSTEDFLVQAKRAKIPEDEIQSYLEGKEKEQRNLPFLLRQYEGPIYYRSSPDTYSILTPFGPKGDQLRNNKGQIQQPFHQTHKDSVEMYKARVGNVVSSSSPIIAGQEAAPMPTEEPADLGNPVFIKKEEGPVLPEYFVNKDLRNEDGSKRLAQVDASNVISINPVDSIQEFFDYFTGKEGGISSQQKELVLKELSVQGYPLARIEEILSTKKQVNTFLILHEQDHIENKDKDVYWKSGKDLLTPDKVAIEVRASVNALNKLGTPVPWETKPTPLWNPGASPEGTSITDGDGKLSKSSTYGELTSHNFSKLVKKLSKRFKVKVELVYQKDATWLGRYHGGTVFLNTALLKSDTPFHEFAHPFVEAIRHKNPALYESLTEQIVKEGKILARVQELYPELDYDGQIDEAITTAIGNYAAEITSMPKTLVQKIKDFLKEMIHIIRDFFDGNTVILPEEFNPQTTLRDLAALMAKGDQVFELGELSDDQVKYSLNQATKLTVQSEHVDLVRKGDKTVSLREVRDDILYAVGDELNVYTNGQQQGIKVKLKHVQTLKTLEPKYREAFAKALGYESYKNFISEDAYAKEDSPLSLQFPGVYKFLQGKQAMQILDYEVVDEYETGAETELEKKVKFIRQALIKQINHFKKKITEGNPRKEIVKSFVRRQRKLLKALDAIDDAKGMMEFIDTAHGDITESLKVLHETIDNIPNNDFGALSVSDRKYVIDLIYKHQDILSAYSIMETISKEEIVELLGEGETVDKFLEAKIALDNVTKLVDKTTVPLIASWLLTFSNVDPKRAKKYFGDKIARLKANTRMSDRKRERLINEVLRDQERLVLTQETLEDQLRMATREISFGSLWFEAAASSSDQVTSLFSKAVKREEFEANLSDRIIQLRLGPLQTAFEKEQGRKGNKTADFYKDFYRISKDEETGIETLVFAETAPTPAGNALLQELKAVYSESQDQLPESVRLGDALPFIRKSGNDRLVEDGMWSTMKGEWKEITQPLATDEVYGYQTADGKNIDQVPIFYVFRGEGNREMSNEDISKDVFASVLKFAQMSNKYKQYTGIQGEVDMFESLISKREVAEEDPQDRNIFDRVSKGVGLDKLITTDSKRVNTRAQDFINMQYYGKTEKPWIVPIGEKEIDVNKLINFLGKWTGFSTLALNFLSAVNNIVLGNFYMFQEAMARQHYGDIQFDLKKGYTLYGKGMVAMFSDIGKVSGKSKESQLVDVFDAMQGSFREVSGHFITGSKAKKLFNGSTMFFMNHAGEHEMQVSTLFAALASTKVKLADGTETSLWEAYQLDENGKLEVLKGTQVQKNGEWKEWNNDDVFAFQGKLHSINKSLHGNYNDFDKSVAQKSSIGRLGLMFRKFIAPGVRRRFGRLSMDNESDELHQGYFRTTVKLMVEEYTELGRWLLWKENSLTGYEKAQVTKSIYEFGMFVTVVAMFAAATSMLGDDDDKNWAEAFALYQLRRFQSELSFYYNPMETLKIITSPAASVTTIKRSAKFLDQLVKTATFDHEGTHYQTSGHGFKKGDSKLWASFKKMLPVIQGVERSLAPQEAIKYFDKLF